MDAYNIQRYEPGYDYERDTSGQMVLYDDMVVLIDKIKADHAEQVDDLRDALADCQRERTRNADAAARAIDELADNRG